MATFALLQDITVIIDVSITACGPIVPVDQAIGPAHVARSEVLGVYYPCHLPRLLAAFLLLPGVGKFLSAGDIKIGTTIASLRPG